MSFLSVTPTPLLREDRFEEASGSLTTSIPSRSLSDSVSDLSLMLSMLSSRTVMLLSPKPVDVALSQLHDRLPLTVPARGSFDHSPRHPQAFDGTQYRQNRPAFSSFLVSLKTINLPPFSGTVDSNVSNVK